LACRFKFDDERVTKEDVKRALEEQYGGEEEVRFFIIFASFRLLPVHLNKSVFPVFYPTVTTDKSWL